jgi:hypothetical protein
MRELEEKSTLYEKTRTSLQNSQQKAEALQVSWSTLQERQVEVVRDRDQLNSQVKSLMEGTDSAAVLL